MYKRFIFRYKCVSIKTQGGDKGEWVSWSIRRPLSSERAITGKSVISFNLGAGKLKPKGAGNRDSFAFEKNLIEDHIFSVPQTDTGALVEYTKASGRQWFKELGNKN